MVFGQKTGSSGDGGVPPASSTSPAASSRSSRNRPPSNCTPVVVRPTCAVETASAGRPVSGKPDLRELRPPDPGKIRPVQLVRERQLRRDRHEQHRMFLQQQLIVTDDGAAANQCLETGLGRNLLQKGFDLGNGGDGAGIAILRGHLLPGRKTLADPEPDLQFHRLLKGGNVVQLAHLPAGIAQPRGGVHQRLLHLRHDLQPARATHQGRAARLIGKFQRGWHPPWVTRIETRHRGKAEAQIRDAAADRAGNGGELRADRPLRAAGIIAGDAAEAGAQPVHPAGIGRVTDGAGNVGAMGEMADAGGDGSCGPTRGTARGARRVTRVFGGAMEQTIGEPAQRESRRVGAAENRRAGAAQIRHHRTVLLGDISLPAASCRWWWRIFFDPDSP